MARAAIDTSALLALVSPRDQWDARAVATARAHAAKGGRWVGSVLVLAELHGHLLRWRPPHQAHELLEAVRRDVIYEWREVDATLIEAAYSRWLMPFAGQRFSLTDAVTFELMRRERLTQAFAFDTDFETAGFCLQA